MDHKNALAKINQILGEERLNPTVQYVVNRQEVADSVLASIALLELQTLRLQSPRQLEENPRKWTFQSINHNLLCALLGQASEHSVAPILNALLARITTPPGCATARVYSYANWKNFSSELPLVAEFCLRAGFQQEFFRVLGEANPFAGHMMLLRQLGEMIALNFTILTDDEYQQLDLSVFRMGTAAKNLYDAHRKNRPVSQNLQAGGSVNLTVLFSDISDECGAVREACRKARYFYLKGSLLEGLNLEINQDKVEVQGYLSSLGFNNSLAESLDEADRLFHQGDNAFVLKSSMGHLRSFLENLHKTAMPVIQNKFGGSVSPQWGGGLNYLRTNKVLSEAEEKFVAGLYTFISDEAVHPLFSDRKYARLARNVLIEYALLFLRKLDALGLKL